jgi:enamine deaminase RidA (YjgF/YER057c/UK114 family)
MIQLLLALIALQPVFPPGVKPVGPYSPGISAGEWLYVSGQGARRADGSLPEGFAAQARQTVDNVRTIVEAAGLGMEHVVYMQVYLADIGRHGEIQALLRERFSKGLPAIATLGVHHMPTDTPIEINAVALRDLAKRKAVAGGVVAADRFYLSGCPGANTAAALDCVGRALESAGLDFRHLAFVNPYLTSGVSMDEMNREYARRFEFGNTPARATIQVASLAGGAAIQFTGVAAMNLADRRAVRPRNMPPSPTASPCVFAGDTLYCSAKAGFIPGPNGGIWARDVEGQVRQTMRNLLDGLEEAGLDFSRVVASNVYLDRIDEFARMNGVYAKYFGAAPPTRTTVAPRSPVERKESPSGLWPKLEEISIVAVK